MTTRGLFGRGIEMKTKKYVSSDVTILVGDAMESLQSIPSESINCCVTSPPYWGLRDYGIDGQIGLEATVAEYVATLVEVFREVRRVLRPEGTLWLNIGDSYNAYNGGAGAGSRLSRNQSSARPKLKTGFGLRSKSHKPKELLGIPWEVAFAIRNDGWYLRQDIIWHKPNPMPESVRDRCTKAHEYIFLFAKSARYYFQRIEEPATWAGKPRGGSTKRYEQNAAGCDKKVYDTRNKRSVWSVKPHSRNGNHFASYPPDLIAPCIEASCPVGGVVLDPFLGSGVTAEVAARLGRQCIGIELNDEYASYAIKQLEAMS